MTNFCTVNEHLTKGHGHRVYNSIICLPRGYGRIMHVEREITVLIMAKLTQATDTAYRFYFNELFKWVDLSKIPTHWPTFNSIYPGDISSPFNRLKLDWLFIHLLFINRPYIYIWNLHQIKIFFFNKIKQLEKLYLPNWLFWNQELN